MAMMKASITPKNQHETVSQRSLIWPRPRVGSNLCFKELDGDKGPYECKSR